MVGENCLSQHEHHKLIMDRQAYLPADSLAGRVLFVSRSKLLLFVGRLAGKKLAEQTLIKEWRKSQ